MSDDDSTEHSDCPDGPHAHGPDGAPIPVPDAIVAMLTGDPAARDAARMRRDAAMGEMHDWLTSLPVEQLMLVRQLLNMPRKMTQFYDGQVYMLLREVRGVNPDTGQDVHAALEEATRNG